MNFFFGLLFLLSTTANGMVSPSEEFETPAGMQLVRRKIALDKSKENLFEEYVKLKGYAVSTEEEEDRVYQKMEAVFTALEQLQKDVDNLDTDIDTYLKKKWFERFVA